MLCLYLYFVILIFVNSKTFQFGSDSFITLCISTLSNCYPFKVTTSIGEILIFNTDEMNRTLSISPTLKREYQLGRKYNYLFYSGVYISEDIYIKDTDIILQSMKCMLVERGFESSIYKGLIGIGMMQSSFTHKVTVIDTLINSNYNIGKQYSIGKKQLILGDEIKNNIKRCSIKAFQSNYDTISCFIKEIAYKEKNSYRIEKDGYKLEFNSEFEPILAPEEDFKRLREILVQEHGCSEGLVNRDFKCFSCKDKEIDEMKDDTIYFMIENWSIKYKVKDLFKNNIFQIQYASWDAYWIFWKNYLDEHMITVNKDSNYILFN